MNSMNVLIGPYYATRNEKNNWTVRYGRNGEGIYQRSLMSTDLVASKPSISRPIRDITG